jgi:nitroreductase
MVRNYSDKPVAQASLERIIDAGVRAPSAGFSQGQRFVVVTDPESLASVADAAGEAAYVEKGFDPWISRAPAHIVVCVDRNAYLERYGEPDKSGMDDWTAPYWWIDAGASMMAILYAAVDEGIAAGFLGAHATDDLRATLGIPDDILVAGIVTLGHAAVDVRSGSLERGRTPRHEVVRWDRW